MKRAAVVIVDGKEIKFSDIKQEKKTDFVNKMNRRALESLGYEEIRDGSAAGE